MQVCPEEWINNLVRGQWIACWLVNQLSIAIQYEYLSLSSSLWLFELSTSAELALKPGQAFRECASQFCPEMVVVPAGSFLMGAPHTRELRENERPQHKVSIARLFAVSKFEVTFDEWDTCVRYGDCKFIPPDAGWGRGRRPVIFVSWEDAQEYVAWLSRLTGKSYRLLTEAEYEYVTRAGTQTEFPWGNDVGTNRANCRDCLIRSERSSTPVGSFPPNAFGLYDMVGNVFEWVQDCYIEGYGNAPTDGSAFITPGCGARVIRGGSWESPQADVRSAS